MVVSGHFLAQYFYSRNKKNVSAAVLTDFEAAVPLFPEKTREQNE